MIVLCALINDGGRFLMARRKPQKKHGGLWEFPGGKLEEGETEEQALLRELREELDMRVDLGMRNPPVEVEFEPGKHLILIGYDATPLSGPFELVDHDEIIWSEPKDLKKLPMGAGDRFYVDLLDERSR
jgi:8-oxo-dGTP diphosphatase